RCRRGDRRPSTVDPRVRAGRAVRVCGPAAGAWPGHAGHRGRVRRRNYSSAAHPAAWSGRGPGAGHVRRRQGAGLGHHRVGPAGGMTHPWPAGAATGVGSLPGTDIDEALRVVFGELPNLPHLPDLARRVPGATIVTQLDEPSVPAVLAARIPTPSGWGNVRAVEASVVEQTLGDVLSVAGTGGRVVHCCAADAPLALFRGAGA